ncbi:MAG TPA: hypothetical protein VHZ56_13580 [Devosia sp.]|jgi:hypothetical protein|nr:hypothetical protein [Devosia sp.]
MRRNWRRASVARRMVGAAYNTGMVATLGAGLVVLFTAAALLFDWINTQVFEMPVLWTGAVLTVIIASIGTVLVVPAVIFGWVPAANPEPEVEADDSPVTNWESEP